MIYEVQMSRGPSIKIDEEDLVKIRENIGESLIQIKQGIINPSFMISIVPTNEKETELRSKIEYRDGKPILTGQEEVKKLADKMSIKKLLP